MNADFRPILATPDCRKQEQLAALRWPKSLSPKLDGIRCILRQDGAKSRKMINIPNLFVQNKLRPLAEELDLSPNGGRSYWADGELIIVKSEVNDTSFNDVQSGIMSIGGEPRFEYHIFEVLDPSKPEELFHARHARAKRFVEFVGHKFPWLKLVPHNEVNSTEEVFAYENKYLALEPPNGPAPTASASHTNPVAGLTTSFAYEGVMLRDPDGPYKFGRSTLKQELLLKWVRRDRCEGVVTGYEPLYHNANPDIKDEFGLAKRQTLQDGLVALEALGSVKTLAQVGDNDDHTGSTVEVSVGSGFDADERKKLWADRGNLIGRILTIEYRGRFPDGSLRFPVAVGWRKD